MYKYEISGMKMREPLEMNKPHPDGEKRKVRKVFLKLMAFEVSPGSLFEAGNSSRRLDE